MKLELELPPGPMTAEDFANLPEPGNGWHLELREGNLLVMSPYSLWHGDTILRLVIMLRAAGRVAHMERGVVLSDRTVPVADVGVFHRKPTNSQASQHPATDYACVIEVLSPGTKDEDLSIKPGKYASGGIPEYWVVDRHPDDDDDALVTVYRLTLGDGGPTYVATSTVALSELEAKGL
jgi:Uma2 family endonuclease